MLIRRFISLVVALAVGALAAPSKAEPVLVDRLVATVETQRIFRSDVLRRARPKVAQLDKAAQTNRQTVGAVVRGVFTKMLDEAIIAVDCERSGIRVEPDEVERALDHLAQSNQLDRKALLGEVARMGMTEKDYRDEIRRQILEAKWVVRKVRPRVTEPLIGTSEEKARATDALVEAERRAELARVRKGLLVVSRW